LPEDPLVTVIVPVRNEIQHIRYCLEAILGQGYPQDQLEILLVDGFSDDGTRAVLSGYVSRYSQIRLLDNPSRIVPTAMNIGIRKARGSIIIRIDARCVVEPDYISQCVHYLKTTGAQNVGGQQRAVGDNTVSKAIALATTSPFGIGNSKFRYSDREQLVDTVYLGAYPRSVFDQIGLYDESLVRNQDYELNHRLRKAGGTIFFTPNIRSVYYGRPSLRRLFVQYFQYGYWKVRVLKKHRDSLKVRHLVAPFFVASLIASALASPFRLGRLLLKWILFTYTSASLAASIYASRKAGKRFVPLLPVIFAILHISWGLGFVWSLLTMPLSPEKVPGTGAKRL
jgi:succinoglycan biosynthesis protein ExoA